MTGLASDDLPVDAARRTLQEIFDAARARIERLSPSEALAATRRDVLLIDIRSSEDRKGDGIVPGSLHIPRTVLEWRLDPSCAHRDPEIARRDLRLILLCDEGYQSSLAAATARRFGLDVTDVIGGFQAWRAAGLPCQ